MKKIKLICIPYAGASTAIYYKWIPYFKDSKIDVIPIELAGRGKRSNEKFYETIDEAVNDIYKQVITELDDDTKIAFFGHSMGSLLVYEVIQMLINNNKNIPIYAFFSGRYPPHIIKKKDIDFHKMPKEDFLYELRKMGGFDDSFIQSSHLIDIFLPILRADYTIIENYQFTHNLPNKMNFDIMILNGTTDESVSHDDALAWKLYTNKKCFIKEYEGGHFFIFDKFKDIIDVIIHELDKF